MNGGINTKKQRIEIIDAARGFAVVLMVLHHFLYDLVTFLDAPRWLFTNTVFDFLHCIFAGLFILLCGVSSNFSRSNLKRGVLTLVMAEIITIVTYFMDMTILFGILHLLAFCMLFYGFTHKLWEKVPKIIMPFFCIAGGFASYYVVNNMETQSENLWMFGFEYPGFASYDYFPVFPWIFVFLFGTWLGYYIKNNKFPKKFYTLKVPVFPAVGRHSLIIYMAHQPVLYLITLIIKFFISG